MRAFLLAFLKINQSLTHKPSVPIYQSILTGKYLPHLTLLNMQRSLLIIVIERKFYPVSGEPHFSAMSALQFCKVSSVSGGRWEIMIAQKVTYDQGTNYLKTRLFSEEKNVHEMKGRFSMVLDRHSV